MVFFVAVLIVKAAARERVRKIFVGGVATDLAEDDIKEYFKTFGEIEDVEVCLRGFML